MNEVYYNEIEEFPCKVIARNIERGYLPPGKIDCRDIRLVKSDDVAGFRQVHLFAGIGGAAYAGRLADIRDELNVWTFGFPCQDISAAGKGEGINGPRSSLFGEAVRLVRERQPDWCVIENSPLLRTRGYDFVEAEMGKAGYTCEPFVVGAKSVGAWHLRKRTWIVANSVRLRVQGLRQCRNSCPIGSWGKDYQEAMQNWSQDWTTAAFGHGLHQSLILGARNGIPNWVDRLKGLGNSWVPQVGALFLRWIDWADQQLRVA